MSSLLPPAVPYLIHPRTRPVTRLAAFALLYASMVAVGRATRLDGSPLALVWPAAAVGLCWLATSWHDRRVRTLDVAALTVVAGAVNAVTGAGWALGAGYAVANGVQAAVACLVMHRWPRGGGPTWRLRTSSDLTALVVASSAGSLVASLIGPVALHLHSGDSLLPTMGAWALRNGAGTFVFAAVVLRLADRGLPRPVRDRRQLVELVGVGVVITVAYAVIFLGTVHLPLTFLLVPLSLWVALRFDTTVAAAHVLLVGGVVVVATLGGRGPFIADSVSTRVLLAQAYVTAAGLVALVLALHRDELARLQAAAVAQTELFDTVLTEMDEGIALLDADGRFLVRNAAAVRLMGGTASTDGRVRDAAGYGLLNADGTPCTRDQMADAAALRGETVDRDYLLRRGDGTRVLATRARQLTTPDGDRRALVVFGDATRARQDAHDIARARDLFGSVLSAATDLAIISTDLDARITVFNVGAERLLGYAADEVIGRPVWFLQDRDELAARLASRGVSIDRLLADDGAGLDPRVIRHVATRALGSRRTHLRRSDGTAVPVMSTVSLMYDDTGTVCGAMSASRDLTAEIEARADLADSEERFQLAFANAPVGMMMIGLQPLAAGAILRVNPALTQLLGYTELEMLTMNVADLSHPDDLDVTSSLLADHVQGSVTQARVEKRYRHADGSTVWARLSTSVVRPHDWEPYSLALIEDVSARRRAEEALRHQALHDPLTGLPNRSLLADRLDHALASASRTSTRVGLLYLDLDGFKDVNDTAGHATGDELLQHVAERISRCIRPGDTLARLGGDEFAVVCPGVDSGDDAGTAGESNLRQVAERILAAVAPPVHLGAGEFTIGVSIGVCLADPTTSADEALRAADTAMYAAKHAGRNRVVVHGSTEHATGRHHAQVLSELLDALSRDELVVHGQPVVDAATGRVVAVETLVRWQHPRRGLLAPAQFLAAAQSSTLVVPLGRRVLDESCRLAAAWSGQLGAAAPRVHVNVSVRQLEDDHLLHDTLAALSRYALPADLLVLELSEAHLPMVTPRSQETLLRLRRHGVRIAVGEVGTGSGLSRLTELPLDVLKVDVSVVAGLGTDPRCDAVVRAVVGIRDALGLSAVAVGVETPEQADVLRDRGCDALQGFHLGRPLPEAELLASLLASATPTAAAFAPSA